MAGKFELPARQNKITFTYAVLSYSIVNDISFNLKIAADGVKRFETFEDAVLWCRDKNANQTILGVSYVAIKAEVTTQGTIFAFALDGFAFQLTPKGV